MLLLLVRVKGCEELSVYIFLIIRCIFKNLSVTLTC